MKAIFMNFTLLFCAHSAYAKDVDESHLNHNPVEASGDSCSDMHGKVCSADKIKELKTKAKVLAETMQEKIFEHAKTVNGKTPIERAEAMLRENGYVLNPDIKPEDKETELLPYFLQSNDDSGGFHFSMNDSATFEGPSACKNLSKESDRDKRLKLATSSAIQEVELAIRKEFKREPPPLDIIPFAESWDGQIDEALMSDPILAGVLPQANKAHPLMKSYDEWGDTRNGRSGREFIDEWLRYGDDLDAAVTMHNKKALSNIEKQFAPLREWSILCEMALNFSASVRDGSNWESKKAFTPEEFKDLCSEEEKFFKIDSFEGQEILSTTENQTNFDSNKAKLKTTLAAFINKYPSSADRIIGYVMNKNNFTNDDQAFKNYEDKERPEKEALLKKLQSGGYKNYDIAIDEALAFHLRSPYKGIERIGKAKSIVNNAKQEALLKRLKRLCESFGTLQSTNIEDLKNKMFENLSLGMPLVEEVTRSLYPSSLRANQQRSFDTAKSHLKDFVSNNLVPGLGDKGKLLSRAVSELGLYQPALPEKMPTIDDPLTGRKILDVENLPLNEMHYQMFRDPSLSAFTQINAFYSPEVSQGIEKVDKFVYAFPGLLQTFSDYPVAIYGVLAHEVGHSIGPQVAKINGYPMRAEWKKVLDCMKASPALRMKEEQSDECIADWFAAQSIANLITQPPQPPLVGFPTEPGEIARQALLPHCLFANENQFDTGEDSHPGSRKRINGILAAHPVIRKALGCPPSDPSKGDPPYCPFEERKEVTK